ncbi:hypothetical protein [Nocardia sp. NPDC057030]|uniref:hypothetical protein n=1 Tax=unclassified Nocardia TaxID=2637762 RepID=UPI00363F5E89
MGTRLRGIGSVLVVATAVLCGKLGTVPVVSAEPLWGTTYCTGAKAENEKEKPFIVQACQRAVSASVRATTAAVHFHLNTSPDETREGALEADAAATATAATAAALATANLAANMISTTNEVTQAAHEAARAAIYYAREASKKPTDVTLADQAAEAEEKAVVALQKVVGTSELDPVEIPRLTSEQ